MRPIDCPNRANRLPARQPTRARPLAFGALAAALTVTASFGLLPSPAEAQPQARKKPPAAAAAGTKKPAAKKPAAKKPVEQPAPPLPPLADATPEQPDAAERVYYGHYACEFDQAITLHSSPKHLAYVDLTHGKNAYLMKPVLSSTGAIRLEDVRGATLMVQIANKSMLLDVLAGRRLVDECITQKQRDLIEAARQAKAAAAAAAVAGSSLAEPAAMSLLSGPAPVAAMPVPVATVPDATPPK